MRNNKYDIIHPTYYVPYIIYGDKSTPYIITVHDMTHELFPKYFANSKMIIDFKKNAISKAAKIIAISENTKNDILKIYPQIDENKISVIYHGISCNNIGVNTRKENYILFTGQRWGYKNFKNFLRSIAPLLIKYDLKLICTGIGFNKKEQELLIGLNIFDRAMSKFVSDEELFILYANALAFVFPSLYEGFGFPVLEAFAAGCPTILSKASSLPEIGGNASIYFDPYSIEDMRKKIDEVIMSPNLRNQLINDGKEQVKKYTWDRCVKETAKVYESI
jgi:glycosyltransferase involved in cell wall biosynthesis